jgi:hypothetical protein
MISANRQLPVTAIYQYCQPNGPRPSKITKRIQRRSHGTPRVEHIIDQHHGAALHVNRQIGMPYGASGLAPQVVAVHRDVKRAHRNSDAFHLIHNLRKPVSQRHTPSRNPHEHQACGTAVRLKNLVGHPSARAGNLVLVHHHPRCDRTGPDAKQRIVVPGFWRSGT